MARTFLALSGWMLGLVIGNFGWAAVMDKNWDLAGRISFMQLIAIGGAVLLLKLRQDNTTTDESDSANA